MNHLMRYKLLILIVLSPLILCGVVYAQNSVQVLNNNNATGVEAKHAGPLMLFNSYREAKHTLLKLERGKALAESELKDITNKIENAKENIAALRENLRGLKGEAREVTEEKIKGALSDLPTLQARGEEGKKLISTTTQELEEAQRAYQKASRDFRIVLWVYLQRFLWIISFFALVLIVSLLVQKNIPKWVDDPAKVYKIKKLTKLFTWLVVVAALLFILLENIRGALTVVGLIGAGIAISLQDIFKAMVGWVILVAGKGIKPGDRIKVGDLVGDVLDINLLHTRLLEAGHLGEGGGSTGRGILLTNNFVFSQPVINYPFGYNYVWTQIEITATFESDWEGIIRELKAIIDENTNQIFKSANVEIHEMCLRRDMPFVPREPHIYMTIAENGYHFTMRFLTPPKGVFALKHLLSTKIAKVFEQYASFEFAYPTQRVIPTSEESHPLEMVSTSK